MSKCNYICQSLKCGPEVNLWEVDCEGDQVKLCTGCEQPMHRQDLTPVLYDIFCKDPHCEGRFTDCQGDALMAPCPRCGGEMESLHDRLSGGTGVAFQGLSTPGANFPKPVKDWLNKRKDQIRETGK